MQSLKGMGKLKSSHFRVPFATFLNFCGFFLEICTFLIFCDILYYVFLYPKVIGGIDHECSTNQK